MARPKENTQQYITIQGKAGLSYSKGRELGKGAFATVYHGLLNNSPVAVKRILIDRLSESEDREVKLQSRLQHQHVLKILAVEDDDDFRYVNSTLIINKMVSKHLVN